MFVSERRPATMRGANGVQDDGCEHQQQRGDTAGEQVGGHDPAVCWVHGLVAVHRDNNRHIAVGDAVETMNPFDAIERGAADPDGIGVRRHGLEHVAAGNAGAGIDRIGPLRETQVSLIQPHNGDHAVRADIRHTVEFADGVGTQAGDDHAGERAIAAVQGARHVHVPQPHQLAHRGRTDECLVVVDDPLRQRAEVVEALNIGAHQFRH